jgi:hypothetical protein
MNDAMRKAFEAFLRRTASPGAETSEYYWMLFQAGAAYNDPQQARTADIFNAARDVVWFDYCDCDQDVQDKIEVLRKLVQRI